MTRFIQAVGLQGIHGIGWHNYATLDNPTCGSDACLMTAFGQRAYQQQQWMQQYASGLELWITEWGVRPHDFNHDEQLRNMRVQCTLMKLYGANRIAYFTGGDWPQAQAISLASNPDLAQLYSAC